MPTFAAEELVTLESPIMDRQFTLLTHIYGTLQIQLKQMVKSEKLVSNVRTLFQTQIGPDQELDIMVNKSEYVAGYLICRLQPKRSYLIKLSHSKPILKKRTPI